MAIFDIGVVRYGRVGAERSYLCLKTIIFEETDEVVTLPGTYEGLPITKFGYGEVHREAEERWHDWHHPAQGTEIVPERYEFTYNTIVPPKHVKKIVFPKEMTDIYTYAFENCEHVAFEVDEENPDYTARDGKIVVRKKNDI
ncbi:MAG: hypothetical protein IJ309_03185 [Clostridia bacterium]|nr:hypothetical protein [Clostridia bacterium]